MIVTELLSGLGNQLFQYAVAKQLALIKNVPLKLDVSFFENQTLRSYKLNHYNIQAKIASLKEVNNYLYIYNSSSFPSKILRKIDLRLPRTKRKLFKEEIPWHYESDLYKVSSDIYIKGYWQHYKYFENLDNAIINELTLNMQLPTYANILSQNIVGDSKSVSIHIRRGDYITDKDANNLMGVLPLTYYYSAIEYIKKHIQNPNFYVFSDDLEWAKHNLQLSDNANYVDGGKDYIDLDLMAKCKHNIIANSSFSWWGAYLNANQNKIVIIPKKWVVPPDINAGIELAMPTWIKI